MRLLGWGDLPLDDKAKKAIRENLALTAKAIYHYEMMLLIPDDERLTYLTDNLQVPFKSGQKVGYLIEYGNRCSQYNNYIKEMSLCLNNKTHHGEALKMSNTPTIYLKMGFKQLPLLYSQKHLRNSMKSKGRFKSNHHTHGLPERLARKIPELLNDPVLVYNSPANPNRICVVLNGDGELFGAQYTHTSLDVLLSAGSNGLPESALEYTMSYYPASGTCATNRLDAIYELEEGINAYDNDLEKTNSLPQMIDMMVASGKGWCLADPYSIAAEAGIVPQRYLDVAYVPDNAEPEDKPLGWMDFLEAAEGNAAYAMMLVDRAEWTYPSTMADEDMRCNEVAKIDGKLMLTNGLPVEEADILAFDTVETVELSDKDMAMEAIKQEKDLYNVRTGLVLHPFVEYDTKNIAQVTSAFVPLSLLVGADGHVASEPWSYAVKHYIEPDGNTDGRIGWLPEFADVKVDDTHGIESKSSTYAYLIKMMDKNGSGWCFGDTKSIAETAHSFKLDKELEIDAVMRSDQENRCIAHDDSKDDPGNR